MKKTIVITGAAGGIGKAVVERVLKQGYEVLAVDIDAKGLKKLLKTKSKGVIVNVSSISAFEGSSDALYGTSKAGLIGLTRSCALTFAPLVRVNAVAPGIVDTPLIKAIPKWRLAEFEKGERLKERIQPESVASAVWFLLSEESKHTTGSVIDLNNGGYFR